MRGIAPPCPSILFVKRQAAVAIQKNKKNIKKKINYNYIHPVAHQKEKMYMMAMASI